MEWTDGSAYKGHWVKGVQHGIGIMIFNHGKKIAGFFENNIFMMPVKDEEQIDKFASEIPQDIKAEILEFLRDRKIKTQQLKDDGVEIESDCLQSEQQIMGQELKPHAPE